MATIIPNSQPIYLGIVSTTNGTYDTIRIIDMVVAWEISEGKQVKPIFSIYDNTSSKSDALLSLKAMNGTDTIASKNALYILIYPKLIKIQTSEGSFAIENSEPELFKWLNG